MVGGGGEKDEWDEWHQYGTEKIPTDGGGGTEGR